MPDKKTNRVMRDRALKAEAEVERLKKEKDEYAYLYEKHINTAFSYIKAEAYKEFAELVHCHCESIINCEWNKKVAPVSWADAYEQFDDEVDNLLKEMVGEDNASKN